ncbi:site-specific integrase [Haloarcula pellucida]|nr:site-specific integrase [Halomicroarcula pellucida]MBX0346610.1 tyrosine-type recombinase/integrase [Halomicroarcula pellucida]
MPTDDFSGFRRRYRNALDRLEDSDDLHSEDRDAIHQWLRDRDGDLAVSSLAQYAGRLRVLGERSDIPLVDLSLDDVRELFFELRNDPDAGRGGPPSESTVYNYQAALAAFANHREDKWVEDFDPDKPAQQQKTVNEDDMLTQDEVAALVDACKRPRNQAIVEFLADTGVRLTLAGSLRVKDVDLDGERATYTPNRNAIGLKGAEIKPYPIIDSKASLRVYLRHSHPRPDEPEAALFHSFEGFGDVTEDDGALSPERFRSVLRSVADDAGIDKPVNPHNFRHTAVTRMWREGWGKQEIQHRVQWSLDTNMWQRYVHVTAEQMNEEIFAEAGVVEDDDSLSKERTTCGNCRETIPAHADYCSWCGEPNSREARETKDSAVGSLADGLAELDDAGRRQFVAELLQEIEADPSQLGTHESPSSSRD